MKLPEEIEKLRDELNQCHPIDEINDRFFSPFKGMQEIYALQKGVESGFEIGFDAGFQEGVKHERKRAEKLVEALNKIDAIIWSEIPASLERYEIHPILKEVLDQYLKEQKP